MADLLLTDDWDLSITETGDLALTNENLSVAQTIGNSIKLILGESWYDPTSGLSLNTLLNEQSGPNLSFIQTTLNEAAMKVAGVVDADTLLSYDRNTRRLTGTIYATTQTGKTLHVTL
ncbi:hypothetical protein [Saccharibacter floricola]|uniref:Uncharacterized protein n=1 Tax=Saccharibacter floricola DSM 15669 TaxID=1123227 RepID=A0ABQ0P179_9PROT|nr:hypothetical protein [Saccharibacter floricola]GBQ08399.1 hypothetical protein AA15669_1760 [Saccharibacter floricola DSM 15669]